MLSTTVSRVEKADQGRGNAVEVNESEAVTEKIEEEEGEGVLVEVMRIKAILIISNQRENVLFDSLRILQQTKITVDVLQATEIGKAVNALRKHTSKRIRLFARTLISSWKAVVDEWIVRIEAAFAVQEEGLGPSPPLEEGGAVAVAVAEENAEARRKRDPWKVAVSEGKIRLRKVGDGTNPQRTSTEQEEAVLAQPDHDEAFLGSKLEAAKRKLREGYLQFEKAKRQRTIQVIELREIPKKTCSNRRALRFRI